MLTGQRLPVDTGARPMTSEAELHLYREGIITYLNDTNVSYSTSKSSRILS